MADLPKLSEQGPFIKTALEALPEGQRLHADYIDGIEQLGFTGSTGARGFTGSRGFIGLTGSRGTSGFVGSRGFNGSKGDRGYAGSRGVVGFVGSKGNIGYTGSKGIQGFSGSRGVVGYVGSKGNLGYTGSRGTDGDAGDIGYTGSQGTAGTNGYTGSRGTAGTNGWTGSKGDRGYAGSRGIQGVAGFNGSRGARGFNGSRGFTGSRGVQGVQGFNGSRGVRGFNGSRGFIGSQGAAGVAGFNGSRGARGFNGSQGAQGWTGSRGFIGFTGSRGATGFVGSRGTDGTNGWTGSQGARGYNGSRGFTGSRGATGFVGSKGTVGFVGSRGVQGWTGSRGFIGYTGSKGAIGYVGSQGEQGDAGNIGFTGSRAYTGSRGWTGSRGASGFVGSRGTIGYAGSRGYQGSRGVGFTGSRGALGYNGSQGPLGFTGSKGAGFTGSQGVIGALGYTGSTGAGWTGSQGISGYTGSGGLGYTGSAGAGFTGSQGIIGYTGSQGIEGPVGPAGIAVIITGTLPDANSLPEEGEFVGESYMIDYNLHMWNNDEWNDLGPFRGIQGYTGSQGIQGEAGIVPTLLGTLETEEELPLDPEDNDAWVIDTTLFVWTDAANTWVELPSYAGPVGEAGAIGYTGSQGAVALGITIIGEIEDIIDLPDANSNPDVGDAYLLEGGFYYWGHDEAWHYSPPFLGYTGSRGFTGSQGAGILANTAYGGNGAIQFADSLVLAGNSAFTFARGYTGSATAPATVTLDGRLAFPSTMALWANSIALLSSHTANSTAAYLTLGDANTGISGFYSYGIIDLEPNGLGAAGDTAGVRIARGNANSVPRLTLYDPGTTTPWIDLHANSTIAQLRGRGASASLTFPTFSFNDDTDTGFSWTVADTVALVTGANIAMTANSTVLALPHRGLNFGSRTAASANSVASHIALYGAEYGFGVTGSQLNIVSPTTANVCIIDQGANTAAFIFDVDTGQIFADAVTSNTVPTYTFLGDPNTGIATPAADNLALITGGVRRLNFGTAAISANLQIRMDLASTAAAPAYSFTGDTGTGMFQQAAASLGFAAGGAEIFRVGASGLRMTGGAACPIRLENGTAALPSLAFDGDTNTGMYWRSADSVGLSTNGVVAFYISNDQMGVFPNHPTTASAATCHISAGGGIYRSTSSLRYKKDIEPLDYSYSLNLIENIEPIWYRSKSEADPAAWSYYGFIAEDVAEIDPRLAVWGYLKEDMVDGEPIEGAEKVPDGVAYDRMVVPIIQVLKEALAEINTLKARVATLEGNT